MKRLFLINLSIFSIFWCFCLTPAKANSYGWETVIERPHVIFQINTPSIMLDDYGYANVWTKVIHKKAQSDGTKILKSLYLINCTTGEFAPSHVIKINNKGRTIDEIKINPLFLPFQQPNEFNNLDIFVSLVCNELI